MTDQAQTAEGASAGAANANAQDEKITRSVNKTVLVAVIGLVAVALAGVALVFWFVASERQRDLQGWQIRLGIVADGRAAAVEEWLEEQFAPVREAAELGSTQIYLGQVVEAVAAGDDAPPTLGYLQNLVDTAAEKGGFKPLVPTIAVRANVTPSAVAGMAMTNRDRQLLVATSTMPAITGELLAGMLAIPAGQAGLVGIYRGVADDPTIAFIAPVYSVQGDVGAGSEIGYIVGVKVVPQSLFDALVQPGETEQTAETYLVRAVGPNVEYLSPMADGTQPLKRRLALDTPDNADAFVLSTAGGFSAQKLDYKGERVLVTGRPLSLVPWTLVRKVDAAEALAESERRQRTLLTTFLLAIVGVGITIVAVWRHGTSVRAAEAAERHRIAAERFANIGKFLKVVTDGQPTSVVAVTELGEFTFANATAAQGTGITQEEMLGKTMAGVWGPVRSKYYQDINREVIENLDEILASGETFSRVKTFQTADGRQVIRSFHIPLRPDRDHPAGCLMILDDITDFVDQRERRERVMDQLVSTILKVVGRQDPFTAEHAGRAAEVAAAICNAMGLDDDATRTASTAAKLMNLGRASLPKDLLTKAGKLAPEELAAIRAGVRASAELLQGVEFDGEVAETIRQVHERWDGNGEPRGLKGDEILESARVAAVADAFAGMISARAHRPGLSLDKAEEIISAQAGTVLDRKPVTALLHHLENGGGREDWADFATPPSVAAE